MRPRPPPSSKPSPRPQRTIKLPDKKTNNEPKTKQESLKNDIALLMKSIDTNLSSIDQVLKVFRIATPEIIELLTKECSLIFECKICKNLFRSLANFMTHKRGYCLGKFEELFQNHEHCDHTWYAKCRKSKTLSSRSTTRKDILTILESMKHMTKEHNVSEDVILKDLPTTNEGLFNLRYESQEPKEKEKIVTVEPVDVDSSINAEPIDSSKCSFCGKEFTSQKALNVHTKADHGDLRMCFVCPCCKKYFANTWSVYRHMYKVHRKTSEQVRKLRTQIQKKQVTLEELNRSKKSNTTSPVEEKVDQDKAYMEELRGHASLQRCSGCGKKFERKVALLSHAAHCQKKKSIPPEVIHTLKRKSLTPMRVVEEKKLKLDDAEMIIRMKALDPRVVLKKTEFPINFDQQISVSSSSGSSCKDEDTLSTGEEEVNCLVQRYKGDCEYNENIFEDLLNKLHMEVPIDDTLGNSDSEYSDCESKNASLKATVNGIDASNSDSESDEYESEESDASLSSGDEIIGEQQEINDKKNINEESSTDNIDVEDAEIAEVDELDENEVEEPDENEDDSEENEIESEDNGVNEIEENSQNKMLVEDHARKCEESSDNNNDIIEEYHSESINEDSSSAMNESLVTSEVGTSYLYEGQEEIEEAEEVEGEGVMEVDEEEAENVVEVEDSENHEEENNEEEIMDEEIDEEEIEEKEVYDSHNDSETVQIESTSMNDIDSKDSSLDYISGLESSKEGENSKDYLSLVNDKETLSDNLSNDSISNINLKDNLFSESSKKKECTLVMDSGSLMMDDTIDNYDVAKEIVLFNDCEEVCISTLSDGEPLEDSLPSNQIATDKHSSLVNGDSPALSPSSPQAAEHDDDGDVISEKWDCVSKKINSYISCTKKKCLLCLKTFHRVNYVRRHVALHFNINKFKCLVNSCNFQSYLRSDMNNHLIRIHKKKELDPFVGRLFPKKEDFDECDYNPDPKPLYAFEKHYRTSSEDMMKKNDIELRILSDKEDSINSAMLIDGSDLDIIEETEVATVESVIPQQTVMQYDSDLDDSDLKDLSASSSSEEKLKALMMEVIFGNKIDGRSDISDSIS